MLCEQPRKQVQAKFQNLLGLSGKRLLEFIADLGGISHLIGETFYWSIIAPFTGKGFRRQAFFKECVEVGVKSLPIVALVTASIGLVLALQSAYQLKKFGALMYTGSLVSVSMARELGPLIVAIIIAGRIGAAIAAEIGTMRTAEEIDALDTMAINPVYFLVTPKFLALFLMVPCLTALGDLIGMFGGYVIGVTSLGIGSEIYIDKNFDALVVKDVTTGLIKSFFFAGTIAFISCFKGLRVRGGAEAVGQATTQAVVISIVMVVVLDCLFTAIFYYVFP
jgi:phospholipid/cholesterol/gamma-HCH transport system permease protein